MPVTYRLVEDNRVQQLAITEPWDVIVDLIPAMRALTADLDRMTNKAHLLIDLREAHHLPLGVFGQVRHEMRPGHPMRGQAVLVGGPFIFKEIFRFIASSFRYEGLRIFDYEEEAWDYLRKLIADEG